MKDIRVRLPRKLNRNAVNGELTEAGRLHPAGPVGITLNMLPIHRASMTLAENDLPLAMHDLVEIFNHNGSAGVYRVTKITNTYRKSRKIELAHGLDVFSDSHFSSIEEFSGTVEEFLQKVINAQTQSISGVKYWQLGECEDSNLFNKSIKYDNLMECLTEVAGTEEDYMFTYDMSTFPWTLNFVLRNSDILSEFRLGRNVESCAAMLDDSDMCNRLYLSVTSETEDDHGHGTYINEGYYVYNNTDSQAEYGIICKTAGVNRSDFSSQEDLEAWVDAYFDRHSDPGAQITIDGIELNQLTGESIDETHISRMCRVALPDYSSTFLERIVSVHYPDALGQPFRIQASLANKRQTSEDAFSEIRKKSSSASGAARSAGILAHNEATYFRRAISDTANGLYSRIDQTAYYIRSEVADMYDGLYSRIEQTASYIRSELADTANGLYSRIEQTASSIRSEVSDATSSLRSSIQQQAGRIDLVVSGSGSSASIRVQAIVNAINESEVTISADRINLDGYVTADELAVTDAKIGNLISGLTQATSLRTLSLTAGTLTVGTTTYHTSQLNVDGSTAGTILTSSGNPVDVNHGYFTGCTASQSGETVTLTFTKGHGDPVTVNFSKAGGPRPTGTVNLGSLIEDHVYSCSILMSGGATAVSGNIDCEDVWNAGYNAGWQAARGKIRYVDATYLDIKIPGEEIGTEATGYSFRPSIPTFTQSWGVETLNVTATSVVQMINRKGGGTGWINTSISRSGSKEYDIG